MIKYTLTINIETDRDLSNEEVEQATARFAKEFESKTGTPGKLEANIMINRGSSYHDLNDLAAGTKPKIN